MPTLACILPLQHSLQAHARQSGQNKGVRQSRRQPVRPRRVTHASRRDSWVPVCSGAWSIWAINILQPCFSTI